LFRKLCLLLLTAFLICRATDVASLLVAKCKASVVCDTGTCDNEKTEVEKINDDQLLTTDSLYFGNIYADIPLKQSFLYAVSFRSEIFYNLLSPPPELI
jgi:hypothetical protein